MVHFLLNKYKAQDKPLEILDVGCGTGAFISELKNKANISGIDFSEKAVSFCKMRGIENVILGGGEKLPWDDNRFDVVLVLDVLEHIEEDRKAIAEIHRVLKSGGMVIAFVPAFLFLWGITDEASHHFRRYTKQELVEKLESQKLKVIRSSYFNTFLFLPILLVRKLSKFFPQKYKPEQETDIRSELVNKVFYLIFKMESLVLRFVNFPFGVSLMVIGRKE
jgi:ubiquinone/menaquinone biosynthesis C-methylase UbiE